MTPCQRLIAGIAGILIMMLILDLVRRRKLREEYSMLWLAAGLVAVALALHDSVIFALAKLLGTKHPAYSLFVIALGVGMVLAVHFTVVLSKLTAQNWRLTQEIGLLRTELDELRSAGKEGKT